MVGQLACELQPHPPAQAPTGQVAEQWFAVGAGDSDLLAVAVEHGVGSCRHPVRLCGRGASGPQTGPDTCNRPRRRPSHNRIPDYPAVAENGRVICTDTRLVLIDALLREELEQHKPVNFRKLLNLSVQIWVTKLDAPGNANPISYLARNGKQYVAIVATNQLVVFAVP